MTNQFLTVQLWSKDTGALSKLSLICKCVLSWTCFVNFRSNLVQTLFMLGYMFITICFAIGSKMVDWQTYCFLKMCGILDMLCQFSFKFGTYIIHVRIHVHDNLSPNQIKDGWLVAILIFENVVSWTCFVCFCSNLVHTLHMLGYMSMTICYPIRSKMADWQPSWFLKMCGILEMLCQFSFKFGTYIIHVMIHVHVNLFCNWINDDRLAAILFFETVLSWTCFVSFHSIWYRHYSC